jgi:hypothetical protein
MNLLWYDTYAFTAESASLGAEVRSIVLYQVDAIDASAVVVYRAAYAKSSSQLHVLQRDVVLAMQRMRECFLVAPRVFFVLVLWNVVQTRGTCRITSQVMHGGFPLGGA